MDTWMVYAIGVLAAYLVGGIPFGFLIGKMRGVDVRTVGSKNIGATNVYRTVGHKWGFLAFFCDFLKGFVPALIAVLYVGKAGGDGAALVHLPLSVGFAAVLGHTLTPYMKFKGGKGVATAFGMLMALATIPVLMAFAVFVVTVWLSHYISLGSCLAAATIAALVWVLPATLPDSVLGWCFPAAVTLLFQILVTLLGVFVIYKHKSNIRRLIDGCENKIY